MSWQQGGKMYHGTNMTLNYFGATKESLPYHEGSMVAEGIDEATGQPNTVEVYKAITIRLITISPNLAYMTRALSSCAT